MQNINEDMIIAYSSGTVATIKIITPTKRVAIIMHSPSFYDSAVKVEEELEQEGYEVHRLNGGVEEEYRQIEELEKAISTIQKYL
ncbi:MAG: hypothetical protein DRJ18_02615 [Candidatus Methanomethylicota archaeon]|nr:MAG: hypothetical protein DRJ18_02615 [Candidatus Verstraetearchaeota archaeon]